MFVLLLLLGCYSNLQLIKCSLNNQNFSFAAVAKLLYCDNMTVTSHLSCVIAFFYGQNSGLNAKKFLESKLSVAILSASPKR